MNHWEGESVELYTMRYVLAVAEYGNFSLARIALLLLAHYLKPFARHPLNH
jgi:hypothetical protein